MACTNEIAGVRRQYRVSFAKGRGNGASSVVAGSRATKGRMRGDDPPKNSYPVAARCQKTTESFGNRWHSTGFGTKEPSARSTEREQLKTSGSGSAW
jgi:hypothetical protein